MEVGRTLVLSPSTNNSLIHYKTAAVAPAAEALTATVPSLLLPVAV
jgi:hypothetical protein